MIDLTYIAARSHATQQGEIIQKGCMVMAKILGIEARGAEIESIYVIEIETVEAREVDSFQKSSTSMVVAEYQPIALHQIV